MVAQEQAKANAALESDTKRCVSADADNGTTFCACRHDGAACVVIEALAPALVAVHAALAETDAAPRGGVQGTIARTKGHLPCRVCPRAMAVYAGRLEGVRLGKQERRVLLAAARPDAEEGALITPPMETAAAAEATRRAIRTLSAAWLVNCGYRRVECPTKATTRSQWVTMEHKWYHLPGEPIQRAYWHRTVWLSPLGAALVARLRHVLEGTGRIRWAAHRAALTETTARETPALLADFRVSVFNAGDDIRFLLRMVALRGKRERFEAVRAEHKDDLAALDALLAALDATHAGGSEQGVAL